MIITALILSFCCPGASSCSYKHRGSEHFAFFVVPSQIYKLSGNRSRRSNTFTSSSKNLYEQTKTTSHLNQHNTDEGGDDDESYLLSQALNPDKITKRQGMSNSRISPSTNIDDPLLSLLYGPSANSNSHHRQSNSYSETSWYEQLSDNQSIPFDCTGCGKCCQTKGAVYLNPKETDDAANSMNMSLQDFKAKYISREIRSKSRPDESWTVLKQKRDSNDIEGCIFLDEETKMCSIYEARPLQCSTYPFWPRVMESLDSWNEEVVSTDDAISSDDDQIWSSERGGCEGMRPITLSTDERSIIHSNEKEDIDSNGVSVNDALDRLETYSRYKRSFPSSTN